MWLALGAAAIALAAALSAYVMVKFYGVVFLGQPRDANHASAHDADRLQRAGLLWLAGGCVVLGLVPVTVIGLLDQIAQPLTGFPIAGRSAASGWLFLAPIGAERASYGPVLFLLMTALPVVVTWLLIRLFYPGGTRRAAPWDCGFPWQDARMQDSAEGFGQPVRHVFEPYFRVEQQVPDPFDAKPRYSETASDRARWKSTR